MSGSHYFPRYHMLLWIVVYCQNLTKPFKAHKNSNDGTMSDTSNCENQAG